MDAHIRPAAAEVGAHRAVDVGVARLLVDLEQRDRRHDLAALAIAALHDVVAHPGILYRAADPVLTDGLDRRELAAGDGRYRRHAGAALLAVDMHRARPAYGDAAAELGSREAEHIAQHPEHRRVAGHIRFLQFAVQAKRDHGWLLLTDLRSGSPASHGAPLLIHRRTCSSNPGLSNGGTSRPGPGCQPQATRWSVAMCCSSIASERPPFVPGSRNTLHSLEPDSPNQVIFIFAGGMRQPGCPSASSPGGACATGLFCVEWQVAQFKGATPLPSTPRCTAG